MKYILIITLMFVGLFMSLYVMVEPTWFNVIVLGTVCVALFVIYMRDVWLASLHDDDVKELRVKIRQWWRNLTKAASNAIHR